MVRFAKDCFELVCEGHPIIDLGVGAASLDEMAEMPFGHAIEVLNHVQNACFLSGKSEWLHVENETTFKKEVMKFIVIFATECGGGLGITFFSICGWCRGSGCRECRCCRCGHLLKQGHEAQDKCLIGLPEVGVNASRSRLNGQDRSWWCKGLRGNKVWRWQTGQWSIANGIGLGNSNRDGIRDGSRVWIGKWNGIQIQKRSGIWDGVQRNGIWIGQGVWQWV